ncbi:MAG: hypothetical protein WBB37_09865 [bacterium]
MKKILMIAIIMATMLLVSCKVSQKDTIVGSWVEEDSPLELQIKADGTIFEIEGGKIDKEGTWKISEKAPWTLSIYEDGELQVEISVKFINDNEVELKVEDETIKMKRK